MVVETITDIFGTSKSSVPSMVELSTPKECLVSSFTGLSYTGALSGRRMNVFKCGCEQCSEISCPVRKALECEHEELFPRGSYEIITKKHKGGIDLETTIFTDKIPVDVVREYGLYDR